MPHMPKSSTNGGRRRAFAGGCSLRGRLWEDAPMAHAPAAGNPYTRGMSEFIARLRYEAIPDEVRSRIKLLMLDALGCALFGADLEWSRLLRATLAELDASASCTVWGTAERLSAPHAA